MARKRRFRKGFVEAMPDVTAFMNLMIVLVPVLLVSMVFTHTGAIDLQLPTFGGQQNQQQQTKLEVIVRANEVLVADSQGGIIKRVAGPDFAELSQVMVELKRRAPEKRDIFVLLEPDTSYQTLVSVLDSVRSYRAEVDGQLTEAELFPDISLGDAPKMSGVAPALGANGFATSAVQVSS